MAPGSWYPPKDNPGIFVSVLISEEISPEIIRSYSCEVSPLDPVERKGLVYLVAFDLTAALLMRSFFLHPLS